MITLQIKRMFTVLKSKLAALQCFARAGKMEPNRLFNGFGPLQPAVAMHWLLPDSQRFHLWVSVTCQLISTSLNYSYCALNQVTCYY